MIRYDSNYIFLIGADDRKPPTAKRSATAVSSGRSRRCFPTNAGGISGFEVFKTL